MTFLGLENAFSNSMTFHDRMNPDVLNDEEKIGSQGSSTVITFYFETCYVASTVSPGGVVVITPD